MWELNFQETVMKKIILAMMTIVLSSFSQANTFNAAIRFDNAQTNYHEINNTVVHEGWAWSLAVVSSTVFSSEALFNLIDSSSAFNRLFSEVILSMRG